MMRLIGLIVVGWMASAAMAGESSKLQKMDEMGHYSIMAVVNDDVISSLDVADRMKLVLTTSGRPDTPEIRNKLSKQVIKSLIEERLKMQAAKRNNISISGEDVEDAIRRIEKSQNKPEGSLVKMITDKGLSTESFKQQIKGEVAWNKILVRKIKRDIKISEDEVRRSQQRIAAGKKVEEWQIATVLLPSGGAKPSGDLAAVAQDVRSDMLAGMDVSDVMAKYQSKAKLEVGPATWIQRDLLNPAIKDAMQGIEVGGMAPPAITPNGIQLIRLMDRRTTKVVPNSNAEVALKQIILKMNQGTSKSEINAMMDVARSIAKYPGSCIERGIAGTSSFEGLDIDVNYIRTTLANMSAEMRPMVEPLSVTGITEPFAAPDGIHLLMLCERIDMPPPLPDESEVRQVLFQEKMELEAEKYLRTLRREALIDVRV